LRRSPTNARRAGRSRAFFDGRAGKTIDVPLYRRINIEPGARVAGSRPIIRRGRNLDIRSRQNWLFACAHRRGRVYRDGAEGLMKRLPPPPSFRGAA